MSAGTRSAVWPMIAMPTSLHLRDELLDGELDAEARDRLELVERPARVAEAAAAHLPERDAAGRDDRADRERRLVADAAGRVLVDDLAPERAVQVDRLAAPDHRVRQRERLRRGQAAEADGHQERGHLVVGHLAARVAEDELARARPAASSSPSPLALDQLGRADHADARARRSACRPGAATRPCRRARGSPSRRRRRTRPRGSGPRRSRPGRSRGAARTPASGPWTASSGRSRGRR